jgi:hypothetical protein
MAAADLTGGVKTTMQHELTAMAAPTILTRKAARAVAGKAASLERRIMQLSGMAYGVEDWLCALHKAAELWRSLSETPLLAENERHYARLRYHHCAHPATHLLMRQRYQADHQQF